MSAPGLQKNQAVAIFNRLPVVCGLIWGDKYCALTALYFS